jgi:PPE-repeat protein
MSVLGDAAAVTPEINHTLMVAGDLGESLVQAAAGYESVADMLIAELTAMGLNTSTTAMVAWQGPGGIIMEMTAAEFMAVCAAASAWIRVGQVQAAEVAAAHTAAVETMIPAAVCLTNRSTQAGLVATNWIGQNTPGIIALDGQYYGHFWVTNATARTGYGQVVTTALGAIAEPPPLSPTASDPAAAAAGAAQAAAQSGSQGALQVSAQTMTQTASAPAGDVMSGGSAGSIMSSMAGEAGGLFGEASSALGPLTSAGQQFPSMLAQAPSMFSGMLGPLMSGANGGIPAGAIAPEALGALARRRRWAAAWPAGVEAVW